MVELRRYELYVIFQPELEEEELENRIGRMDNYLTGNGGEIIELVRKGKRRLEYSIKRYNQGIDVIYQVNLPASLLETLERQLNLNEDVIRYLLVRRDDLEEKERLVATEAEVEAEVASLRAEPTEVEVAEEASVATDATAEAQPDAADEIPAPALVDEDVSPLEGTAESTDADDAAEEQDTAGTQENDQEEGE